MESEVELKGGRGADSRMIAFKTRKGNGTMELVGVKMNPNKEREAYGETVRLLCERTVHELCGSIVAQTMEGLS